MVLRKITSTKTDSRKNPITSRSFINARSKEDRKSTRLNTSHIVSSPKPTSFEISGERVIGPFNACFWFIPHPQFCLPKLGPLGKQFHFCSTSWIQKVGGHTLKRGKKRKKGEKRKEKKEEKEKERKKERKKKYFSFFFFFFHWQTFLAVFLALCIIFFFLFLKKKKKKKMLVSKEKKQV
jgi:ABC-type multidrug transport system fused ATPase/permease subunit